MSEPTRFNVQLDEAHAAKLRAIASRTHMNPGTLARSLLSTALDEVDPEPASVVDLLDSISGAFEEACEGLEEGRSGQGVSLEELEGTPTERLEGTPTEELEGTPTEELEGTPTERLEGTPTEEL